MFSGAVEILLGSAKNIAKGLSFYWFLYILFWIDFQ